MKKNRNLAFVFYLMSADRNLLHKLLMAIWDKQRQLTNSPNFTYKGELYILERSAKVNPLHKSLYPEMKDYLSILKQTEEQTELLNKYFLSLGTKNPYLHVPSALSKQFNLIVNEEDIVYHPIFELIQEKLLMILIGD